ncbi:hypothetical protein LC593_17545 [Nostoc sp. CHAB 5844]|nr:hypothetical protein [Nostoc sp. CHAB 5844]
MNSNNYSVALNFLALTIQDFTFTVYRKLHSKSEKKVNNDIYVGTLPIQSDDKDWREKYWIALSPTDDFESFTCHANDNHYLTKYFLHHLLKNQLSNFAGHVQYSVTSNRFESAIFFTIKEHPQGNEVIRIEPYYLSAEQKFGFLIDFEFHKKDSIPFNREVQKLSLSLDENYKSNKNFYTDKFKKIQSFIGKNSLLHEIFSTSGIASLNIDIEKNLYQLKADTLNSKIYIFRDNKEGQSPFQGIRNYGPLKTLTGKTHFYFAFTDEARDYAVDLYKALRGQLHSTTFPGLSQIFQLSI